MRKSISRVLPLLAGVALLAACSSGTTTSTESAPAQSAAASEAAAAGDSCGTTVEEIAAAAQAEGQVNLIALPDTWANYGGILKSFRETYGIEAPVANPDASSADELTAVTTLQGQPDKPDSIDIGPSFTQQAIDEGLVEPYKTTNWDQIPDNLKDANGNWIGSYYGIMSIATNATLVPNVPTSFADLLKPEYKGMVTLNGDPREAGAAFAAVVAASLANGGSFDDLMPGIEYFAKLKEAGNLQVIDVTEAAVLSGDVPIALDWTYNFPGLVPALQEAGFDFQIKIPTDGFYGGYYAQSVVSDPVHPCAARLWMEHITGDAGALGYIEGGAVPARLAALQEAGLITPEMQAKLPTAEQLAQIAFPTPAQVDAMKAQLTENWGPMVADK
ncbi:MAG: ABC transporter substrate-binding protein [Actinomycetales bacterium]|nr:ABC transporter substrate-binding protein [Actinomycetales bacterium]